MVNPVNWRMLSHPINWVTVILMLVIAGTAGHLLLSLVGKEPSTDESSYSNLPAGQSVAVPIAVRTNGAGVASKA